MARYADNHGTIRTLSDREVDILLRTTGERRAGFRDHCLFAFALATGLRMGELLALNIGDIFTEAGGVRRLISLKVWKGSKREGASKRAKAQEVRLPEGLRSKLARLLLNMARDTYSTKPEAPLFASVRRRRLSERMARAAFQRWQEESGFERRFTFHELRHTAVTGIYRRSGGDIKAAQRFARHADIGTTQRYAHVSDERMGQLCELMPC